MLQGCGIETEFFKGIVMNQDGTNGKPLVKAILIQCIDNRNFTVAHVTAVRDRFAIGSKFYAPGHAGGGSAFSSLLRGDARVQSVDQDEEILEALLKGFDTVILINHGICEHDMGACAAYTFAANANVVSRMPEEVDAYRARSVNDLRAAGKFFQKHWPILKVIMFYETYGPEGDDHLPEYSTLEEISLEDVPAEEAVLA
jgi:hypothetical protein